MPAIMKYDTELFSEFVFDCEFVFDWRASSAPDIDEELEVEAEDCVSFFFVVDELSFGFTLFLKSYGQSPPVC